MILFSRSKSLDNKASKNCYVYYIITISKMCDFLYVLINLAKFYYFVKIYFIVPVLYEIAGNFENVSHDIFTLPDRRPLHTMQAGNFNALNKIFDFAMG